MMPILAQIDPNLIPPFGISEFDNAIRFALVALLFGFIVYISRVSTARSKLLADHATNLQGLYTAHEQQIKKEREFASEDRKDYSITLKELNAVIKNQNARNAELSEQYQNAIQKRLEVEQTYTQKFNANEDERSQLARVIEDMQTRFENQYNDLKDLAERLDRDNTKQKSRADDLIRERDDLKAKYQAEWENRLVAESRLKEIDGNNNTLTTKITELNQTIVRLQGELDTLTALKRPEPPHESTQT